MDHAAPLAPVWTRQHLLGLQALSADEITQILDTAVEFKRQHLAGETKQTSLKGVTVGNLFFEPSTRTKTSFSLAAKRLSADTVDFTAAGSSDALDSRESGEGTANSLAGHGCVIANKDCGHASSRAQRRAWGIHRPETSNPLAHLRQFFTRSLPPVEKAELRAIVVHDAARCPFEPQSGLT